MRTGTFVIAATVAFALALPSVASADYTWTDVNPGDGEEASGSTQEVGAAVHWGPNDANATGGGVRITVINRTYIGEIHNNVSYSTDGQGAATFDGTIEFDAPLVSGDQYTIEFRLSLDGPPYTEGKSVTVTVP